MKKILDFIQLIFVSMISGSTAVIPGVSGGTILAIFNLTEELTKSIKDILENLPYIAETLIIKPFKIVYYLSMVNNDLKYEKLLTESKEDLIKVLKIIKIPAVIGIGSLLFSIVFAKIVLELSDDFSYFISFLFIGLIIFSLPILWKEANDDLNTDEIQKSLFIQKVIYAVLGFIIMLLITILFSNSTVTPGPEMADKLSRISFYIPFIIGSFFAGMMAIIPGISGTNVMIMFGIYDEYTYVTANLNDYMMQYILYIIMTVIGIIVSSFVLNFIYKRFRLQFFSLMTGLTAATLFSLNPFASINIFLQILVGFIIAYLLIKFLTNN